MTDEQRIKLVEVLKRWYEKCRKDGIRFDLDTGEIVRD